MHLSKTGEGIQFSENFGFWVRRDGPLTSQILGAVHAFLVETGHKMTAATLRKESNMKMTSGGIRLVFRQAAKKKKSAPLDSARRRSDTTLLRLNELVLALALEYLGYRELVAFDSAVQSREDRGHYLTALSRIDAGRLLAGAQRSWKWLAGFSWVVKRGLCLPVRLRFPNAATDATLALLQRCSTTTGRFLREVSFDGQCGITRKGLAHL